MDFAQISTFHTFSVEKSNDRGNDKDAIKSSKDKQVCDLKKRVLIIKITSHKLYQVLLYKLGQRIL